MHLFMYISLYIYLCIHLFIHVPVIQYDFGTFIFFGRRRTSLFSSYRNRLPNFDAFDGHEVLSANFAKIPAYELSNFAPCSTQPARCVVKGIATFRIVKRPRSFTLQYHALLGGTWKAARSVPILHLPGELRESHKLPWRSYHLLSLQKSHNKPRKT